jgi:multiple sugar transport system substrate-binding protein
VPVNGTENSDAGKNGLTGRGFTRREFLAGGAGLLLLVGCGGTGDPAVIGQRAASGGGVYEGPPVELAFWNGFTGGDGPAMRELVDRFNDEHENISVAMNVMIWDPDFYQKTPAAVGSGNGPDVGIMHVDRLATNAARGVIVPLDEVADSLGLREEDFAPVAWESGYYDGQRYGIPLDVHPLGLFYNKKVMREAGLDPEGPPTTGDEYMRMLEEIKGNDVQGSWISPFLFTGGFWFRTLVWQFGGELYDEGATRATYNSDEGVEALTWMVDLIKNGYSPENVGQDADQVAFQNNDNAFHWNGIWMVNAFKENPDLDWGVAPLPRIGTGDAAYANSHNFVLFNQAEPDENKLQASKVFMDWIGRNSLRWAEAGQIPARTSVRESGEFEDLTEQSTLAQQVPYLRFNPQITGVYEIQTVLDAAYNEAVLLAKDPKTSLDEAAGRADKLLEENRQKYGEVE